MATELSTENKSGGGCGISAGANSFQATLSEKGLTLDRLKTDTLQVNVGLLCNQECAHCHVDAGPKRTEVMDKTTMDEVVKFARRGGFSTIDITGGAPEMNPHIKYLIEKLAGAAPRIMLRSNLTALSGTGWNGFIEFLKNHKVVIVASMPSLDQETAESQRGNGVFEKSILALKKLNETGYGKEGSGLELNLVANPVGDSLGVEQSIMEKEFKDGLKEKWDIEFNNLFSFTNAPLGRFRDELISSGAYDEYIAKLAKHFNPAAIEGAMCRSFVSTDWNGYLYDCDFNLAMSLPMGGKKTHVSEMAGAPDEDSSIAIADHCFACVAGTGFT